jgi:predicted O-methyltransferase YrrM
MTPIRINRTSLSQMVWQRIFEHSAALAGHRETLLEFTQECDTLPTRVSTGSINAESVWALYSIAAYFKPQVIAEVGTYVGRSTVALAEGQRDGNVSSPVIYTCDAQNNCDLSKLTAFATSDTQLEQFKTLTSTHMFRSLVERKVKLDLLHLDGRLVEPDFPLIKGLLTDDTLITLDDFEFDQKGQDNARSLLIALGKVNYQVVYPAPGTTTAMLLPRKLLHFTEQ